jgi:hypothetical protein
LSSYEIGVLSALMQRKPARLRLRRWLSKRIIFIRDIDDWRVDDNELRAHESPDNQPPLVCLPRMVTEKISTFELSM